MSVGFYGHEQALVPALNPVFPGIRTPVDLYEALMRCWCAETCAPRMRGSWRETCPTLGQCSVTAFLAQDLFGGKVYGIPLEEGGFHCYNDVDGCVFDLTSEQFPDRVFRYEGHPEQFREVHFAKEEKRLRYELLWSHLRAFCVSPEGLRFQKKNLRAELKARAKKLSEEERRQAGEEIARLLLDSPLWREARSVLLFRSLPGEPDTAPLCEAAWAEGKTLLLPRCVSREDMEAVPFAPDTPLSPDAFGLPCPQGPAFREDPDLVLVPCLSVTRGGVRLGRGAGCYDRYLARHPGNRICLCFDRMLSEALPEDPWDIRVPLVLTEKGFSGGEPRQDPPA